MKTGLSRLVAGAGVAALVAGIAVYSQSNLEAAQQTKHLTPLQADQRTGVTDTQATRLNPQ